jgi:hypothetical protein
MRVLNRRSALTSSNRSICWPCGRLSRYYGEAIPAPLDEEGMMAQRRTGKSKRRGKKKIRKAAPTRAKAALRSRKKRAAAKFRSTKRVVPKTKKRAIKRKIATGETRKQKQPAVVPVERINVDTVEEPVPSVVVTEDQADIERKD